MKKLFLAILFCFISLFGLAQSFTGVTASGTDTYAITVSGSSYFTNQSFEVRFTNPNTGAATLTVTANGVVQAAKAITTDGSTPVTAGQLSGAKWLIYNGTNFQIVNNSSGGGGTPGGSTTQVQFNLVGAFAGNSNFTINNGTGIVTFGQLPTIPVTPVASTDAVSKGYVDGLTLGPFSTVAAGYTNLSGAAGNLLKGDNTWLGIGTNTYVLTSNGTTFSWAAPSGGGLSGLTTNQMMFALSSTTIGGSSWHTWNNTTKTISFKDIRLRRQNGNLIEIPTVNSVAPDTPANYGSFWHTLYDSSYLNSNGRYDAVYQWGFNQNGAGGNRVTTEAEFHVALENDYDPTGSNTEHDFEFHIESTTNVADGSLKNRHFSLGVNKHTGGTKFAFWHTDGMTWNPTNSNNAYFDAQVSGTTTIFGTAARLHIQNVGGTPGDLLLSTDASGNGTINQSGGGALSIVGLNTMFSGQGNNGIRLILPNNNNAFGWTVNGYTITGDSYPTYLYGSASNSANNYLENTHASGSAYVQAATASGTGDPATFYTAGSFTMETGLDQSDGSKYKIGKTKGFGSNVFFTIDQNGSSTHVQNVLTSAWTPVMTITPGAHTGITASTVKQNILISASTQQWATGALSGQANFEVGAETLTFVGASTATEPTTLLLHAPIAGTNANAFVRPSALTLDGHLFFKTGGIVFGIIGTTTNDASVAGNVGEEIPAIQSTYTNYTTTATYQNITSIALTAGDWDISAEGTLSTNSSTLTTSANTIFVISTTTASAAGSAEAQSIVYIDQNLLGTSKQSVSISPYRVSLSGSTTYYLNTQSTFTLGNPQFVGSIRARRIR